MSLKEFASGHEYFGLHFQKGEWVFREWAPNATTIYLIGDMSKWQESREFELEKINDYGDWEIRLNADKLKHGDLYRLRIHWAGGKGDRIPAYARRVVQDPKTLIFNAQVWSPPESYFWKEPNFKRREEPPIHLRSTYRYGPGRRKNRVIPRIHSEGSSSNSRRRATIHYS